MPVFNINGLRILFIHVPKSGGTSITEFLGRHGEIIFDEKISIYGKTVRPRHFHAEILQRIYYSGMFDHAFMVVRNPIDRLISEYSYQRKKRGLRWQNFTAFEPWLRYSLWRSSKDSSFRENHFRPQSEFSCFDSKIFRFEDGFGDLARQLSELTGMQLPSNMGNLNKSRRQRVVINQSILDLIQRKYFSDFECFGYPCTFDVSPS